jgi:hypothetical protein
MSVEAMSIDEVMRVANDFGFSPLLRHVIEQHVAEAVAREMEECAKACETQSARWHIDPRDVYVAHECAAAIRARAEKGTT